MKGIAVATFVFVFLTGAGGAAASDRMDNYWTDEQLVEWEEFVVEHHQQKQTPEKRERELEPRSEVIPNLDPLLYFNKSRAFLLVNAGNDYNIDFFEYQLGWEVQITQTYCAIAAATAAFNSLNSTVIDRDGTTFAVGIDQAYAPYQFATQADVKRDLLMDNCSHCACLAVGGKENAKSISRIGLGIGNVPDLVNCYLKQNGYFATAYRNDDDGGMLKETIINAVTDPMKRVIVNYKRKYIGQGTGGGHWSPIASYNQETDMLLLMDVAKYKYPPVWVTWDTLVAGTVATTDTEATLGRLPDDLGIDWEKTDDKNKTEYKQIITLIEPYTTTGPRGFVVMAPTNPIASKSKSKRSKSKSSKSKKSTKK